jgi:hypothetical protein
MNPFSAKHLLVGCLANAQLDQEGGLYVLVVDAFAMLSPGLEPFLDSLPTWFLVNKQPGALVYLIIALSMMLDAAPRHRDKICALLKQLETFKCRPWDRIAGRRQRTERATAAYADRSAGEEAVQDLDRLYDLLSRPEALKSELELLSERPERLYDYFHTDNYGAELQVKGRSLARWYTLMLEPRYLASEFEATLSWWQDLSLDGASPQDQQKKVTNDVFRLLEFLRRLNFDFAKKPFDKSATSVSERSAALQDERKLYSPLSARTRNWLAKSNIESVPEVLQLELHSKVPRAVRKELGAFQYAEQIKGGFDPRRPLNVDEIRSRLMNGGLLFRGTIGVRFGGPREFLSLGHIRDGWVLCARRGSVFLRGLEQERDYIANMIGFDKVYVPPMRRPQCWFGVLKPIGFEQMGEDLDLSREIFGLDYGSLQAVLDAYERMTRSSEKSGLLKITYSKQDRECNVSRNLIPARFPYIEIRDVGYVGTDICLQAFFDLLALLPATGRRVEGW